MVFQLQLPTVQKNGKCFFLCFSSRHTDPQKWLKTILCAMHAMPVDGDGNCKKHHANTFACTMSLFFTKQPLKVLKETILCVFFLFFCIRHHFLSKCLLRMWKCRKSNLVQIFLWRTKVSEAVCKRDWHNVRSYLFFSVRKFQTRILDSLCKDL